MANESILILFYLVILIYSIIIHEISHGVAALFLGDKTAQYAGRLNLNPLNHIDWFGSVILPGLLFLAQTPFLFGWAKPVPYNPYNLRNQKHGPLLVALAGPLSNFVLAFLAALIALFLPMRLIEKMDILSSYQLAAFQAGGWGALANDVSGSALGIFFALLLMVISWNVVLGCFNLIPIPPLDGSKILFVLFDMKEETIAFIEQYGFFLLLFIVLFASAPVSFFITRMLGFFFGIAI